ncbi:D-alanine--D-alanine ligase family protein [Rhodococcoides corynebacterioides]|uniref:D-alanine--D-alanine ligase family protein n=1 Tax=Rhodococcoides corynebacterioides TaxID=53972 RepID=UPI003F80DEFF
MNAPPQGRTTVLHLVGSAVDTFHADLSRVYAADALDTLDDPARFRMIVASVDPDRTWRVAETMAGLDAAAPLALSDAVAHIDTLGVDVILPQMFCLPGMTTYRALADLLGIPLLGNGSDLMALTADKARTRAVVADAGVPVPTGRVLTGTGPTRSAPPLPAVVKPADSDNSVGVTLVRMPEEFDAAVTEASRFSSRVLVEDYVELGREVRCGVVVVDGEPVCLPLEEYAVDAATAPIRTREDKLRRSDDGELYLAAKTVDRAWIVPTDDPVTARVHDLALRAHAALGCRYYSLFDFRIDPEGTPWFLEAGLYCSYARGSVVTTMAAAAGIDARTLFDHGLRELERLTGTRLPRPDGHTDRSEEGTPS